MPTVSINDTSIYYERAGEGPAVLFIHGMCGSADVFREQAARLEGRYTCVRYDRRGHTRSERGGDDVTYVLHADDAAALIEALDLAPCLVIGSSGGAAIATDVALRHGHLLRGAVLSEPPLFGVYPDSGRTLTADLIPLVERALADGGPRAAMDRFFTAVCPGLWSGLDEEQKARYLDNSEIGLTELASSPLRAAATDLAAIRVPALVISGTRSHRAFRDVARHLAAALTDARLVEIAESGHVTYAEQPDAFARAVAAFASELDRRSASASR